MEMKYISRHELGTDYPFWSVRISRRSEWGVYKTFSDGKTGSKAALKKAKAYRNKEVKRLKPLLDKQYSKKNGQRVWGKGWHEEWTRRGDYEYLLIVAHVWSKKDKAPIRKSFSVLQRGYDEAVRLAEQWRKSKLGKL